MQAIHAMSYSDALAFSGIVISALFGIWGIYLALRRAKYPASLTFVREQAIALLDDFATKLPNLVVVYKGTPINKSVILISGYLVNDGNMDIAPEMVERPLVCQLPGTCTWLEFKITTTATALQAESNLRSSSEVEVKLGLFRRDESFAFQALVLLDQEHAKEKPATFCDLLRWSHRIASLGDVKATLMPQPESGSKRQRVMRRAFVILVAAFYLFFGLSQVTGIGPLGNHPSIEYEFTSNGKLSMLRLTPNRDGSTTIRNIETGEENKGNLAEISKTGTFVPIRSERRELDKILVSFGTVSMLMACLLLYLMFRTNYKRYRIRRLVCASITET